MFRISYWMEKLKLLSLIINKTSNYHFDFYMPVLCNTLKDNYEDIGDLSDGYYCPDLGTNNIALQGYSGLASNSTIKRF